jgi:hypothetical protein
MSFHVGWTTKLPTEKYYVLPKTTVGVERYFEVIYYNLFVHVLGVSG